MSVAPVITLAPAESERLGRLEATIESGLQTFHEVGSALLEIRDSRLYRAEFSTFEDYCRDRWDMSRPRAYQLIDAAQVVASLSTNVDTPAPSREGHARALGKFDADLQAAIMRAAKAHSEGSGKPITAGLIEGVGRVITEAATTGHVDIGDGTSTPILAAIAAESFEHTQRQSQHIREHYEEHDARGRVTPEAREARAAAMPTPEPEREPPPETPAATPEPTQAPDLPDFDPHRRPHVTHNSGNNEWYTPPEYIEAARTVMGGIDLDPASSPKANETVQAPVFYTAEDDGLEKPWTGRVWLNPPYSGDLVGRFADKTIEAVTSGSVPQAVVLVNNATETGWFQKLAEHATALAFPKGRIRYLDSDGRPRQSPLQGQAFLYFGPHREHFEAVFSAFGVTL